MTTGPGDRGAAPREVAKAGRAFEEAPQPRVPYCEARLPVLNGPVGDQERLIAEHGDEGVEVAGLVGLTAAPLVAAPQADAPVAAGGADLNPL